MAVRPVLATADVEFALRMDAPDAGAAVLPSGVAPPTTLEAIERTTIERALEQARGNVSHAAEALGLTRQALYRRMEKYGLFDEGR